MSNPELTVSPEGIFLALMKCAKDLGCRHIKVVIGDASVECIYDDPLLPADPEARGEAPTWS